MHSGFDPAFSAEMKLDHGFMCPLHLICPEMEIPIVPIFVNSTCEPRPSLQRCYELGGKLRTAMENWPGQERIAILATGGLSHAVPVLDEYLYRRKRAADAQMEQKKIAKIKQFVDDGLGRINEVFDRRILELLQGGQHETLIRLTSEEIERDGGNGAQELRNWITLLGALPDHRAEVLVYEPVAKWLTGIAIVAFN